MTCQECDCGLADKEKSELIGSKKMLNVPRAKEINEETLSLKVEMVVLSFQFRSLFPLMIQMVYFYFYVGSHYFLMIGMVYN